jgi:hypothetical protein
MVWTSLLYGWANTATIFVLALVPVVCFAAGGF